MNEPLTGVTSDELAVTAGPAAPACAPSASRRPRARTGRRRGERGEGVISTAIAVLIVALLGVALWTGFSAMVKGATDRTAEQLEQIGG
jgi:hypothetical protein